MNKKVLWVEKFRPKVIDDYVWINEGQKEQVLSWIEQGYTPDLLLSGGPGVGKSSLVNLLMNEMKIDESDIKYVNASRFTGIDNLRDLTGFCETMPMGRFRYVILDEFDRLSIHAMDMLKATIEDYTDVCRWIGLTNRPNKIVAPLLSRLQGFHITSLDKDQFIARIAYILSEENIQFPEDGAEILDEYISVTYPDLRKCINILQQNCHGGVLRRPTVSGSSSMTEYMVQAVNLFKNGKIHEARKLICQNATENDFEEIYKLLYKNLDWWGKDEMTQNRAIVIIANRLRDNSIVADGEMNLAACLIELAELQ